jgi:hypothetical protein
MSTPLDDHGQPVNFLLNWRQRTERDVAELLGLAKGVLADGVVSEDEARYLLAWSENHPGSISKWPISLIFSRLRQVFDDGIIDAEERRELHELLAALVGGTASIILGYDATSELPLDTPPPLICWHQEVYVFTGRFAFGTRAHCEREVHQRGGSCESNITRRTSFLVLGTFGSRDWKQTSYGRKIERAVELRASGFPLRIVGEDHWAQALST